MKLSINKYLLIAILLLSSFSLRAQKNNGLQVSIQGSIPLIFLPPDAGPDISVGWRMGSDYLGIGSGCHFVYICIPRFQERSNGYVPSIPVFVKYSHYFASQKKPKKSFFLSLETGADYYLKNRMPTIINDRSDPFVNCIAGWNRQIGKHIGIDYGLNFRRSFFSIAPEIPFGASLCLDLGITFR